MNIWPLVGVVMYCKKQGVNVGVKQGGFCADFKWARSEQYLRQRDTAVFGSSGRTGSDSRATTVNVICSFLLLDWISKRHAPGLKSQKPKKKIRLLS